MSKNKYIYQSYNKDYYYNNNPSIMGTFSCLCVLSAACGRRRTACPSVSGRCVPAGRRSLLKLSQPGRNWQAGKCWERCRRWSGTGGCSQLRITAGLRWQHLTIYIENVIISVTMITKKLFVTRPSNLRCKAFYGVSL